MTDTPGTVTKISASCPHRKSGACGECFGVLVGRDLRRTAQVERLKRKLGRVKDRLARVLAFVRHKRPRVFGIGHGVWSGPRRARGAAARKP